MKKLSLLLLLSVFVFCSCGDDDDDVKNEVVVSFENLLTEENSQFIADGTPNNQAFQETDFKDPKNLLISTTIMPTGVPVIVLPDFLI